MRKTHVLIGALSVLASAVPVAGAATGGKTVKVQGLAFTPRTVTIKKGQTVTWRFADGGIPHNVTSSKFKSSSDKASGTYKVRFTKKGTFSYKCTIHPTMTAKVVVK